MPLEAVRPNQPATAPAAALPAWPHGWTSTAEEWSANVITDRPVVSFTDAASIYAGNLARPIAVIFESSYRTVTNLGRQLAALHIRSLGDKLLPDVEYPIVLSAPPRRTMQLTGRIRSITQGRRDLAISEGDATGLLPE